MPNQKRLTFVNRDVESTVLESRQVADVHHEPWSRSMTTTIFIVLMND